MNQFEPLTLPTKRLVKLGIQGAPGEGKTFSSCTFPNPYFIALENTLPDSVDALKYHGFNVEAIKIFPFYRNDYVVEYLKSKKAKITHTLESKVLLTRDAIRYFVKEDLTQYSNPQMTWVLDSWTRLHDWFDLATWDEKWYTSDGKENAFAPWDFKIEYSKEILGNLLAQDANVVVIFHEAQERSKTTGELLDKTQPLMQGKFITRIKEYFPNFFRAVAKPRLDDKGKEIIDPKTNRVIVDYMWQVGPDSKFAPKCTKPGLPTFIPAHYKSLL